MIFRRDYSRRALVVCLLVPTLLQAQSQGIPTGLPRILPLVAPFMSTIQLTARQSVSSVSVQRPGVAYEQGGGPARLADEAESDRWRPALLASVGLAATGALVAYWSTNEAEDAYDRYLSSAGAGRQQDALDSAERHDRIAGAGFLIMEAGLVLTARFVFF